MKLWIDDVRPAPDGYIRATSVNKAISVIETMEYRYTHGWSIFTPEEYKMKDKIELIDIDHDAGDYAYDGGDYIKLLDWLEETGCNYPIHIHSANPVGVQNMRAIIERNGWTEVK